MGRSDCQAIDTVKLFCPSCLDIYTPPQSRFSGVDGQHPRVRLIVGAYFGTTFPHLFFSTYPELLPSPGPQPRYGMRIYTPKIYGFKVCHSVQF
jgi:casein kinase II subunit beta